MKKAKVMLTVLALVGVVAGALAFKVKYSSTQVYCFQNNTCTFAASYQTVDPGTPVLTTTSPCGAGVAFYTTSINCANPVSPSPLVTLWQTTSAQ